MGIKHIATWPVTEFDIVSGIDLHDYAPPPHSEQIYNMVPFIDRHLTHGTADEIDTFIRSRAPNSPLNGGTFIRAFNQYKLYGKGLALLMALCQLDSMYGIKGEGAKLHNPGNVNDRDDGHTEDFGTWEAGIMAVADWLSRHKVSA